MLLNWKIPPGRGWWACYKRCERQKFYHKWLLENDTAGAPDWVKPDTRRN